MKNFMAIAADKEASKSLKVTAVLNYKFQRDAPATAMIVTGNRSIDIYDTSAFN